LANIITGNLKNNDEDISAVFKKLDAILGSFGEECDIILGSNEITEEEINEIKNLRTIINAVVNIAPDEEFECPYKLCLRKFASKDQLESHLQRRHKQ
jgi:hypothetical protein